VALFLKRTYNRRGEQVWGLRKIMTAKSKQKAVSHPADRLDAALSRAAGVLHALAQCYEPEQQRFVVGHGYVAESMLALETFVLESRESLADLHRRCDLSLRENTSPGTQAEPATEQGARFEFQQQAEEDDVFIETAEDTVSLPALPLSHGQEGAAGSYEELLRKLTAAEVFAQEQQSIAMPGTQSPLVPLLKSLREELKRVRAA
jgi:hypothetical protein